jgi:hypothetical protein
MQQMDQIFCKKQNRDRNRIQDADYRKVEVDPFVQELEHLTKDEKQTLGRTLKKFPTFFGGGLGAKRNHARPFTIPQSLEATKKLK